jgi:hypothetical protein
MTVTIYHFDPNKLVPGEAYKLSLGSLGSRQVPDAEGLPERLMAEGVYVAVAEYAGDKLEDAYRLTQNGVVTDSWTLEPPEGLTPLVEPIEEDGEKYGHRSSSMGDIFVVDGEMFVVDTVGFTPIGPMPGDAPKP